MNKIILAIFLFLCFSCASLKPSVNSNESVVEENKKTKKQSLEKVKEVTPLTLKTILEKKNDFSFTNAKIQFCHFINENASLFESLTLIPSSIPAPTNANKDFKSSFVAQINMEDLSVLKDLEFIVAYPINKNGEVVLAYEKLVADEAGYVSFVAPKSAFAIDGSLNIVLNLFKTDTLEEDFNLINKSINEEVRNRITASFDYKIATGNRRFSSAIAILDYEQDKKPIVNENTSSKHLLMQLMKNGFSRTGLASFAELANVNEMEIVENAKKTFNGAVELYLYGKTYITKVARLADGSWEAEIQGFLNIWNLRQNKKVTAFDLTYSSIGKTQRDAILKARRAFGEELLFQKILYNL
ncbi:MAG: hypothetical protein ACTTKH_06360 [Treponema sp.]